MPKQTQARTWTPEAVTAQNFGAILSATYSNLQVGNSYSTYRRLSHRAPQAYYKRVYYIGTRGCPTGCTSGDYPREGEEGWCRCLFNLLYNVPASLSRGSPYMCAAQNKGHSCFSGFGQMCLEACTHAMACLFSKFTGPPLRLCGLTIYLTRQHPCCHAILRSE